MNIEDLTLKDLKELTSSLNFKNKNTYDDNGKIKIVILQRGWVMIGRLYKKDHVCTLMNGYTIRRWGTSEGLGELAIKGILMNTKLDKNPTVIFHELTIVAEFICDETVWANYFE